MINCFNILSWIDLREELEIITHYHTTFLARLIAGKNRFTKIEILNKKLLIRKGNSNLEILFFEIDNVDISNRGHIWNTLSIYTKDSIEYQLGGIAKSQSLEIVESFQVRKASFLTKIASTLWPTIKRAFNDAQPFLTSHRYIRHSPASKWFDTYKSLKDLISEPALITNFPTDELNELNEVRTLLNGGEGYVAALNKVYVDKQLVAYKRYFDTVEDNPLTQSQRKSCVIDERYNLVLAGAGTGKTSAIIARAGYLVTSGLAQQEDILLLAYGKEAAKEMDERIRDKLKLSHLTAKTFHSFGLDIIARVEGKKPSLNVMTIDSSLFTKFIDTELKKLLSVAEFKLSAIKYLLYERHPYKNIFSFKSEKSYNQYVLESELRTLNGELVKSFEELYIANFLFKQGVSYKYEEKYKIDTSTPDFRRYEPDFYLPDYDLYIEHFGVDEKNNTPSFMDRDKYVTGMEWKRETHVLNETALVETYSYEQRDGVLLKQLAKKLQDKGVQFNPLPEDELLEKLAELGEVMNLSELLAALVGQFKMSSLKIRDLAAFSTSSSYQEILNLFTSVYTVYEDYLVETQTIDFHDMITKATSYVESGEFSSPYKYILVDEFQDISVSRNSLIKALLDQNTENGLYCVGDDWQSIYRFAGSDLNIITEFEKNYGFTSTTILDKTFRFNNKIGQVASRFIQCNPIQFTKKIESHKQVKSASISLLTTSDESYALNAALTSISAKTRDTATVLILSRFKYRFKKLPINLLQKDFPNLKLKMQTIHASKGKEADYVIIVGLERGKFGLPSTKKSHPLLELLLPVLETFPHAEERRVFYVALTRAKHHVYLVTNPNNPSVFVRELLKNKYEITQDGFDVGRFDQGLVEKLCERCQVGYMVQRESEHGKFQACNSPICKHTENGCDWCQSPLVIADEYFRKCENVSCKFKQPICPDCGAGLKLKAGRYGKFWGCMNYNAKVELSCQYTKKFQEKKAPVTTEA